MLNNWTNRGLIFGIITLLAGATILTSIEGIIIKFEDSSNNVFRCENEHLKSFLNDSPDEEWNRTFGGRGDDLGNFVLENVDDSFIVTGFTSSFGAGLEDGWLIKTDNVGNEIWNMTYGGKNADMCFMIQKTNDNGFAVVGLTESFGAGINDFWLIKVGDNGAKQWDKAYGGEVAETGYSISCTSDNGFIMTGYTSSYGSGPGDIWLVKTDKDGNKLWDKTFGGSNYEFGNFIQRTRDDGFILVGSTRTFGSGGYDIWLIKTDASGNMLWNKTFGGKGDDAASEVRETIDGGFIFTGYTSSFGAGDWDIWLIKTDENGNEQWNKTFGGIKKETGTSVKQTRDENFVVTGYTSSFGAGIYDVWLISIDETGVLRWEKTFGGSGDEQGWDVQETQNGGFVITGYTTSFSNAGKDLWLIKVASLNKSPNAPLINGSTSGKTGKNYSYTFNAVDPDHNDVFYEIDWGDGIVDNWDGPYESGTSITKDHTWVEKGTYGIKARVKDVYGNESEWTTLSVTMPYSYKSIPLFWMFLLQRFPIAFLLLQHLI